MSVQINPGAFSAYEAQLQSRKQLLQAQQFLIKATTQDGASDTAQRMENELRGEIDKLGSELKSAQSQPYSSETMEFLLRARYDTVEIGTGI